MSAELIRCDGDRNLYNALLERKAIHQVNKQIAQMEAKQAGGQTRRHLLATSVRLSRSMTPELHAMADLCVEKLGIDTDLELYAYNSSAFNAACFKPEDGRVFIMFSSALLEAFSGKELLYVMGHELGHHAYNHHSIPIGYILRGKQRPPANLALELFTWSRYAEISADRAGAYCAEDLNAVALALFRLASGITSSKLINFKLDEFIRQVDDMVAVDAEPGQGAPTQDWFSTHPFSPLRVKALTFFHESDLMSAGGYNKQQLEMNTKEVMGLMEPDYIEGKTKATKAMRHLFIAGAIAVAAADGQISDDEKTTIKDFFSDHFDIDKLDAKQLIALLPERIESAKQLTTKAQRMQVIRDLCLVARAEEEVVSPELDVLRNITQGLDIDFNFVLQCTELETDLD